jgi:hypothetical protein
MPTLKILVWRNREGTGEPEVEVTVPANLVKWIPRLMKFVPKKTREETWGQEVDFDAVMGELEGLVNDAVSGGKPELMDVKTKDSHVKFLVDN